MFCTSITKPFAISVVDFVVSITVKTVDIIGHLMEFRILGIGIGILK
jgi:hypothetical protein